MARTESQRKVEGLCLAALELEESQRAAFLEQACGDDEALRREVETLLAQEGKVESSLESPALEVAAEVMAQDQVKSLAGRKVGSYRVLSLLGEGGMGQVYLAQDTGPLDRKLALKFLPQEMENDELARARFVREARSAAALDHPYICKIYETGESDGKSFIAMEYVQGETLNDQLASGPMSLDKFLQQATELAEALETAHERNVVHRDLKPANIMLTPDGHVKVMDFGLAKRVSQGDDDQAETVSTTLTRAGTMMGTTAYMSPEQVRGEDVDNRTDIWSFGLVLYEMLTARKMYDLPTVAETIAAVLHREPSLEGLPKDTPWMIRQLLDRCLRKDPRMRLQHIGDARIEIRQAVSEGAATATPVWWRRTKMSRPLRSLSIGLAVAALGILLFLALTLPRESLNDAGNFPAPKHRQVTFSGRARSPAISPDGKYIAYVSPTGSEDNVDRIMVQTLPGEPIEFSRLLRIRPGSLRWSPDVKELLFTGNNGPSQIGVFSAPWPRGQLHWLGPGKYACWSPDGSRIATFSFSSRELRLISKSTSQVSSISLEGDFTFVAEADWAPIGSWLSVLTKDDQGLRSLWTISEDGSRQQPIIEREHVSFPRWSPMGDTIYYLKGQGNIKDLWKTRISPATGRQVAPTSLVLAGLQTDESFSISHEGHFLAYTRRADSYNLSHCCPVYFSRYS